MNISIHKTESYQQITVSADFTDRKALLTKFNGQRSWSVRGRTDDDALIYKLKIADKLSKSKALSAANDFVKYYMF
jgi:hypothetical protein